MLYHDGNSSCLGLLSKNGTNIYDKTTMKAVASMTRATSQSKSALESNTQFDGLNGCVIPNEARAIFSAQKCMLSPKDYMTDAVQANYQMNTTKEGVLSIDPKIAPTELLDGKATYPVKGCMKSIDDPDIKAFITAGGTVLDFKNQKELYRLRLYLQKLKDECAELDRQIAIEETNLRNAITQLINQRNLCASYKVQIVNYQNKINDMNNNIIPNNRNRKTNAANTYRNSIDKGNKAAKLCNDTIKHCFAYADPNYGGQKQRLQGYINELGFKDISSFILPPGVEARIFTDKWFHGNAKLMNAGIDGPLKIDFLESSFNDKVRSIRVRRNAFYEFHDYGNVVENYVNAPVIENYGNNPIGDDIIVMLYGDCGYNGWQVYLPPGQYSSGMLYSMGFKKNQLSAVRIIREGKVQLFNGEAFTGANLSLNGIKDSVSCLKDKGFNDMINSIIVTSVPPIQIKVNTVSTVSSVSSFSSFSSLNTKTSPPPPPSTPAPSGQSTQNSPPPPPPPPPPPEPNPCEQSFAGPFDKNNDKGVDSIFFC